MNASLPPMSSFHRSNASTSPFVTAAHTPSASTADGVIGMLTVQIPTNRMTNSVTMSSQRVCLYAVTFYLCELFSQSLPLCFLSCYKSGEPHWKLTDWRCTGQGFSLSELRLFPSRLYLLSLFYNAAPKKVHEGFGLVFLCWFKTQTPQYSDAV